MIINLQIFEVNSNFCKKGELSSDIIYSKQLPDVYNESVTNISLLSANIPNTFTQIDDTDKLILTEGESSAEYVFPIGTYYTKQNMMQDLARILNSISPNAYTYSVSDNNTLLDDRAIKIFCLETNTPKKITLVGKYLKAIYGLNEETSFTSIAISKPVNLSPISTIHVRCDKARGYNSTGLGATDILASVDVQKCGTTIEFPSILHTMKQFNRDGSDIRFYLTDFDNMPLDIYDNDWKLTFALFTYAEGFIDKILQVSNFHIANVGGLLKELNVDQGQKQQPIKIDTFENVYGKVERGVL